MKIVTGFFDALESEHGQNKLNFGFFGLFLLLDFVHNINAFSDRPERISRNKATKKHKKEV